MPKEKSRTIPIGTPFIKLDSFLKLADAVGSGGEAKVRIQSGEVTVNGLTEERRGRKLVSGDRVTIDGFQYVVGHDRSDPQIGQYDAEGGRGEEDQ